jgi:uncharacterized membrane protein
MQFGRWEVPGCGSPTRCRPRDPGLLLLLLLLLLLFQWRRWCCCCCFSSAAAAAAAAFPVVVVLLLHLVLLLLLERLVRAQATLDHELAGWVRSAAMRCVALR